MMTRTPRVGLLVSTAALVGACNAVLGLEELPRGMKGAAGTRAVGGDAGKGGGVSGGTSGEAGAQPSAGGTEAGAPGSADAAGRSSGTAGGGTAGTGGDGRAGVGGMIASAAGGGRDEQAGAAGDGSGACADGTFDHDSKPDTTCQSWSKCQPGQFVLNEGTSSDDRVCAACAPSAFAALENAPSCATWQECAAGEYVEAEGTAANDRRCVKCPAGTHGTGVNSPSCTPCSPGGFSASSGATACKSWTTCSPGTYVSTTGSATQDQACTNCPPGTLSTQPNQGECLAPDACPAGTEQTAPATMTEPAQCSPCGAGNYCAGGATPRVACNGETWDHDSDAGTSCAVWTSCSAGNYVSAVGSTTSDRTCAACPALTYSTTTNAVSCTTWTNCTWSMGGVVQVGTATANAVCGVASEYRQFGTSSSDYADAVAVDPSDYIYVSGYTRGTLSGTSAGAEDAYVRKYNANGTVQWTAQFGTSAFDRAMDVEADTNAYVYVGGYTEGDLGGANAGDYDAFVQRYSASGTVQWTKQFGTSGADYIYAVAVDASSNVYVAGSTGGSLDGSNAGGSDAYVRKYSSAGTAQWTRQFGSTGSERVSALTVTAAGDVYAAGFTAGAIGTAAGANDAFVRKYNSSGTAQWTQQFGTTSSDYGRATVVDENGQVYVAGETEGSLSGTNAGAQDAYYQRYSSTGSAPVTRQFGTTGSDYALGAALDASGLLYLAGRTTGALSGSNAGGSDVYVRKYSSTGGSVQWTQQFGTTSDDAAEDLAVDSSGNVYVVGSTAGSLVAPKPGGTDAFVRRITP